MKWTSCWRLPSLIQRVHEEEDDADRTCALLRPGYPQEADRRVPHHAWTSRIAPQGGPPFWCDDGGSHRAGPVVAGRRLHACGHGVDWDFLEARLQCARGCM